MAENPEDTSIPSQTTIAPLKNAGSILADAVKAIGDLAPLYERVKIPGLLVLSGVVLALLSVVLLIVGHYTPGNTSLGEEILMASLAFLFVMLGVAFQTLLNGMQTRIAIETLRIGEERNAMLHEETMAKLKLQSGPSTPDLPNGPGKRGPYELSSG
jgi:hypothetical protein